MSAPALSSFATKRTVFGQSVSQGVNGGIVAYSLGNADIAPLLATGYDIVPFLPDGVTIPTFVRVSYSALPFPMALLYVYLPAGSTGPNVNYPLTIASGNAAATDQSTPLAKPGPYAVGSAANVIISQYPMLAGDTSTTSSPDAFANNGIGTHAANNLTLVGNPTRGSTIIKVPGTSISPPGTSFTTNGSSSYGVTAAAVNCEYYAASGAVEFSHWMWITLPSSFASTPIIWSVGNISTMMEITTTGLLKLVVAGVVVAAGTVTQTTSTSHFIGFTANSSTVNIYVDGVLYATGAGIAGGILNSTGPVTTAQKFYYGCNAHTGTPAGFIAATYDNIGFVAGSMTAAEMQALYYSFMPPVDVVPFRKFQRIPASGSYEAGQLIVGGLTAGAAADFYPLENGVLSFPGGAPGVAGNPCFVGAIQNRADNGFYLLASSSPDPTNRAAWTVGALLAGGAGAISGWTADLVECNLAYDPILGLYMLSAVDNPYNGANNILAVTSPNLATGWSSPITLVSTTQQAAAGISQFNVRCIARVSTGGYVMFVEGALVSGGPAGLFTLSAWASPSVMTGPWTFNSTITTALLAIIPAGEQGFLGGPATIQVGNTTYFVIETGGAANYALLGVSTDTMSFATFTVLSDPIAESAEPWEIVGYADFGNGPENPSIFSDGQGNAYCLYGAGSDAGSNTALGLMKYPGSFAQLFATGTVTLSANPLANYLNGLGSIGGDSASIG